MTTPWFGYQKPPERQNFFLYSAYFDNRREEVDGHAEVRILVMISK